MGFKNIITSPGGTICLIVRLYRGGFPMNQCPPGSQGVRGQLSTGPSGPLNFEAVDRKEIFQPNFSYGVFLVHPTMGRLMWWDQGGQLYGVGQAGRRM